MAKMWSCIKPCIQLYNVHTPFVSVRLTEYKKVNTAYIILIYHTVLSYVQSMPFPALVALWRVLTRVSLCLG